MFSYTLRRLLWMIPVLLAVGLVTFVVMHAAPGGPFDQDPTRREMGQSTRKTLEAKFGLDKPYWRQFVRYMLVDRDLDRTTGKMKWVCGAICGNLGPTYTSRGAKTVQATLFHRETKSRPPRFYYSARLGIQALLLAVLIGIPLGVIAALKQNTIVDYISLFVSTLFVTLPSFIVGLLLLVLAVQVFNKSHGFVALFGKFQVSPNSWSGIRPWFLPTIALGFASMAFITRLTRSSVLEVMNQDYIRTARAKGLSSWAVIARHVLKNSLLPVVTTLGPALAGLLTGSFFIETIFSIPGIGRELVRSIGTRDYSMIMGTGLFYAFLIAMGNLSVDLLYGLLDPRIKVGK